MAAGLPAWCTTYFCIAQLSRADPRNRTRIRTWYLSGRAEAQSARFCCAERLPDGCDGRPRPWDECVVEGRARLGVWERKARVLHPNPPQQTKPGKSDSNFIRVVTSVTWCDTAHRHTNHSASASRSLGPPCAMPLPAVRRVPAGRQDPARREFRKNAMLENVDFFVDPSDSEAKAPFRLEFNIPALPNE